MKRVLLIFGILIVGSSFIYAGEIYLIPFRDIDKAILDNLKIGLQRVFGYKVYIGQSRKIPASSYNPTRNQYHSTHILQKIRDCSIGRGEIDRKILGVIDVDLYVSGLNFVFGEADIKSGISIISITRLRQSYYGLPEDYKIFRLRILKEAVHELGHTFGLSHCPNDRCVMYFSNSLLDTDKKDFHFCDNCKKNYNARRNI